MTRDEELAAQATRVQHRPGGLIIDYLGCGPTHAERYGPGHGWLVGDGARMALVRCIHGKEWPEGATSPADGLCVECCETSRGA